MPIFPKQVDLFNIMSIGIPVDFLNKNYQVEPKSIWNAKDLELPNDFKRNYFEGYLISKLTIEVSLRDYGIGIKIDRNNNGTE